MSLKNTYYVMRHGESEANLKGIIVSSPENGTLSYGLTQKGRRQVVESLNNLPMRCYINTVYSSGFLRAVETAEIAADILGTGDVNIADALRERFFGEYEKKPDSCYNEIWEIDSVYPPEYPRRVEPPWSVQERVCDFIRKCEEKHEEDGILLVSHADVIQIASAFFSGMNSCGHKKIKDIEKAEIRQLEPGGGFRFPGES